MTAPTCHLTTIQDVLDAASRALGKGWEMQPVVQEHVMQSATEFAKDLAKLRAGQSLSLKSRRAREYHFLRSPSAKYCSVLLSWRKDGEAVGHQAVLDMSNGLNPRSDCGEPVEAYLKKKKSGGRWICKFGPKRRALQRLVREVLDASHGVSPFDYCRRGRGANRALLAMKSAAETKGARWFSTSDVKDCYGSFSRERIIKCLPLPRSVIENCILIPDDTQVIVLKDHTPASETAVRRGIPQGSLASPAVAALLLRPMLEKLTGAVVLSFGDDIVTGTRTQEECEANTTTLAQACYEHPAGPLQMKHNRVARLGTPIDVLGYRMRRRWKMYGGGIRFVPSPAAFEKFYDRVGTFLLSEGSWTDDLLAVAMTKFASWKAGLGLWDHSAAGDDLVWVQFAAYHVPYVRTTLMKAAKAGIYADHASA